VQGPETSSPALSALSCHPSRSHEEGEWKVPIVTVEQSPREIEPKRRLVAGITQAFVDAYGVSPDHVQVFIHEVDHQNWAKGGKLALDR